MHQVATSPPFFPGPIKQFVQFLLLRKCMGKSTSASRILMGYIETHFVVILWSFKFGILARNFFSFTQLFKRRIGTFYKQLRL